jgi:hypothetical protein
MEVIDTSVDSSGLMMEEEEKKNRMFNRGPPLLASCKRNCAAFCTQSFSR